MSEITLENYEQNLTSKKKKQLGIFYTDKQLADYMINRIDINKEHKIIDPSCGNGIFINRIEAKLKENFNPNNIYGIDIDKKVITLLRKKLSQKFEQKIIKKNIISGDSLGNKINFLKSTKEEEKFDIIIGNPPYVPGVAGENYNPKLFSYENYITSSVNLAMIMLIRSFDLVKENGIISFILPKNILHVECYKKLRERILNDYTIVEIVDLGLYFKGVRGEQMILTIKNQSPTEESKIIIKHLIDKKKFIMTETKIEQSIFKEKNIISLYKTQEEYYLLEKLSKTGTKLSEIVNDKIFRGVSVIESNRATIAYRGRDIKKFGTKSNIQAIPKDKVNDKIKLLHNKKIIMQNIFSTESGIIASYVNEDSITTETVTNIINEDEKLLKYLLGLINSKLLNYFLIVKIFNDSKLTMHTDKKYIGELPIIINETYKKEIIKLVEKALNNEYSKLSEITKKIDKIIYKIYNLEEDEIQIIETRMNEILSKEWI